MDNGVAPLRLTTIDHGANKDWQASITSYSLTLSCSANTKVRPKFHNPECSPRIMKIPLCTAPQYDFISRNNIPHRDIYRLSD
jgi:hypothetical protein